MISDLRELPSDVDLGADVCIVGSGPAGLTLATELARTKHKVLLLEAGGFRFERETQELYGGAVAGRNYPVMSSRLRVFGGTSGHWTGQCGIPPPRHMRHRPWVASTGWPISPADLLTYYEKASRLLQLGSSRRDETDGPPRSVTLSDRGPLVPFVWRRRADEPLRFGDRLKREMEEAANVHVVLHANVTRVKTSANGKQIQEIQFSTLDGHRGRARARYYVLACGGLENPRILLNTDEVEPAGLGNSRGFVGRYFMEHPGGVIGTLFLANDAVADRLTMLEDFVRDEPLPSHEWKAALCLGETFEREQNITGGYYRVLGRPQRWAVQWTRGMDSSSLRLQLRTLARLFDERLYGAFREAYGYPMSTIEFARNQARVFVEFEQAPNPDSRVLLTPDRDRLGARKLALDWRMSEQDIRTARAMGEAIGREAYLSGWGRFKFADWIQEKGIERSPQFGIAYHHIGTTRMANDPQFGVVDSDCRVFSCANLYIAGSSVFPTASFVNPTLTIVALAYRLADTLKARLG